jgi:hypothetical protein
MEGVMNIFLRKGFWRFFLPQYRVSEIPDKMPRVGAGVGADPEPVKEDGVTRCGQSSDAAVVQLESSKKEVRREHGCFELGSVSAGNSGSSRRTSDHPAGL